MHITRHLRRLVAGIAVAGAAAVAVSGPADAWIDTDPVTLTDTQVSFGGSILGVPTGPGHVKWDIVSGYYTPRLMGTLSMNGANGKYARMHISYWDGGGNLLYTRHGGIVQAPNNGLNTWSVDLSPTTLMQITEVHVCTELSSNGVDFPQVDCSSPIYLY